MQKNVKVVAGAKKNIIKKVGESLKVYVTAPASDGKANKAVVVLLCGEFKVAKSQITIIKGLKSRHKTIIISEAKT